MPRKGGKEKKRMDAKKVLLLVMFFAVALQTKEDPNAEWAKKKIEEFKSSVTFSGLVPRDYVKGQDIEFTVCRLDISVHLFFLLFIVSIYYLFVFLLFFFFFFCCCWYCCC